MLSALLLFSATVSTLSSSRCTGDNAAERPNKINVFADHFDINNSDELQILRDNVLTNACNFGDASLSNSLFSFASDYINLHCGSYGAQPKYVVKYHDHIRNVLYSKPHLWDDVYSVDIMNILREEIADYLGIRDLTELVFTINASHGISAVIRSLMDHFLSQYLHNISDYSVIYFSTGHPAYIALLKYYQRLFNIQLIEVQFDDHIIKDYDRIIQTINNTLIHSEKEVLFGIFSHISSLPSFILPFKQIIELFKAYDIMTIVDGAHAFGQIPNLNLSDSGCDIYVANAYKWFYSVWNTAVIYVKKEYHDIITPLALGYHGAPFQKLFHHPGTVDESAYLSLMASLEFRYLIGGEANIIHYIHEIASNAQQYLSNLWNTTLFMPNDQYFIGMINVELPSLDGVTLNKQKMNELYLKLLQQNNIAIKPFSWNNKFYVRVSCQIYTDMNQIEQVGQLILQYLTEMAPQIPVDKDEL